MDDKLTKVLLGILALGFTAWSGVVWRATEQVATLAADIRVIEAHVNGLERDFHVHKNKGAHAKAAEALARIEQQIKGLEHMLRGAPQ